MRGDGGGGHSLVRMEWCPAGWSVCLPLLIFPCTMKSRSSLLAPAHPGGPGKRAVKRLWCGGVVKYINTAWLCNYLNVDTQDSLFPSFNNYTQPINALLIVVVVTCVITSCRPWRTTCLSAWTHCSDSTSPTITSATSPTTASMVSLVSRPCKTPSSLSSSSS